MPPGHFPLHRAWDQAPTPGSVVGGTRLYLLGQPLEGIQAIAWPEGHGKRGTQTPGMRYRDLERLYSSAVMSSAEYERYIQPLRCFTRLSDGFGRAVTWSDVEAVCRRVNPLLQPGQRLGEKDLHGITVGLRDRLRATLAPQVRPNGSVITSGIPTVG
jgi:hypothetical protein